MQRKETWYKDPVVALLIIVIYIIPVLIYASTTVSSQSLFFLFLLLLSGMATGLVKGKSRRIIVGIILFSLVLALDLLLCYIRDVPFGELNFLAILMIKDGFPFVIGFGLASCMVEVVKRYKRYKLEDTDIGFLKYFLDKPFLLVLLFIPYIAGYVLGWDWSSMIVAFCALGALFILIWVFRKRYIKSADDGVEKS